MLQKAQSRPDLLLLLSLLLVILIYPVLDHGDIRRSILGVLMFLPVTLAIVRLSEIKGWVWPSVLLMLVTIVTSIASIFYPQSVRRRDQMGASDRLLRAYRGRPVLLPQECPLRHRLASLYRYQHLPAAWDCSGSRSMPPLIASFREQSC